MLTSSNTECKLKGSTSDHRESITIITLEEMKLRQSQVPNDSKIAVAASRFLDNDIYFDMVASNIARGVSYRYLLPKVEQYAYETLKLKIAQKYPKITKKLEGERLKFIPRANLEFPMNYVVYVHSSGLVEGFIGILQGTEVNYFQVADIALSFKLFDSFKWLTALANDSDILKKTSELEVNFNNTKFD